MLILFYLFLGIALVADIFMEAIEQISEECKGTLQRIGTGSTDTTAAFRTLEKLIDLNQQLLEVLGVSHQSINNVCRSAAAYDVHAKLTGAGGGGCVFALVPPDIPEDSIRCLQQDLHFHNYDSWKTSLGAPGVLMHRGIADLVKEGHLLPKALVQ